MVVGQTRPIICSSLSEVEMSFAEMCQGKERKVATKTNFSVGKRLGNFEAQSCQIWKNPCAVVAACERNDGVCGDVGAGVADGDRGRR